MKSKLIAFIAGSSFGALSALTGIYVTAKILNDRIEDCDEDTREEKEFFITKIDEFLKSHNIEKAEEFIHTIEDVCDHFTSDYRKFLVSLYDFICHDDCTGMIEYIVSIQNILDKYTNVKWMDTKQAVDCIINGENTSDDIIDEAEACADAQ